MFSLRYLNRHFFIEHEGRHYLVDTGCPKSFGIHGHVPWADKTPPVVILDMKEGRLRFHRGEEEEFFSSKIFGYEKTTRIGAPILRIAGPTSFKLIWDSGAQIGYAEIDRIQEQKTCVEAGPFKDFSPIYGTIESANTWHTSFRLQRPGDEEFSFEFLANCQMAEAPGQILRDIRSEGAQGVIGNSWMNAEDETIVAIKGRSRQLHISGNSWRIKEGRPTTSTSQDINLSETLEFLRDSTFKADTHLNWLPGTREEQLSALPTSEQATGLTPVLRPMPRFIGQFQTETIRGHLGMETIDGLIGNDLLLDTLL